MKAGRITISTRKFAVTEVPTPNAGPGQVRIKVGAAGVCLSDVHLLDRTLSPGYLTGDEVTLGHEVAGTIDQLGEGVHTYQIGDRVLVIGGERNEKNQITTLGFDYDGGYAEYVVTKAALIVKIPDDLPFEEAAIIPDAVSTPWAAISSTAKMQPGESAAVFGVGGLGIHAVQLLKMRMAMPSLLVSHLRPMTLISVLALLQMKKPTSLHLTSLVRLLNTATLIQQITCSWLRLSQKKSHQLSSCA